MRFTAKEPGLSCAHVHCKPVELSFMRAQEEAQEERQGLTKGWCGSKTAPGR